MHDSNNGWSVSPHISFHFHLYNYICNRSFCYRIPIRLFAAAIPGTHICISSFLFLVCTISVRSAIGHVNISLWSFQLSLSSDSSWVFYFRRLSPFVANPIFLLSGPWSGYHTFSVSTGELLGVFLGEDTWQSASNIMSRPITDINVSGRLFRSSVATLCCAPLL